MILRAAAIEAGEQSGVELQPTGPTQQRPTAIGLSASPTGPKLAPNGVADASGSVITATRLPPLARISFLDQRRQLGGRSNDVGDCCLIHRQALTRQRRTE